MYNPRFPHTVVVKRLKVDANGNPVYDNKGIQQYETLKLTVAEYYDNEPLRDKDGTLVTYEAESLPFGYRTATQNIKQAGDVVVADFKIAVPMFTTPLNFGDRLILKDYDREYIGSVVKKQTFNLGSNIWFDEIKN